MNNQNTRVFSQEELKQANIKLILSQVEAALTERGYNAKTQLVGYLITNDPAYISSYKGARSLIQSVDRNEIIKELLRSYLSND